MIEWNIQTQSRLPDPNVSLIDILSCTLTITRSFNFAHVNVDRHKRKYFLRNHAENV